MESLMATKILIRFNTKNDNYNPLAWRVLVTKSGQAEETFEASFETYFARNIYLDVPSKSSEDNIGNGVVKWHITAYGNIEWQGEDCYIRP